MAKNPNSMKRASSYAERLQLPLAVIHGEGKLAEHDTDDGRTSPPLPEAAECTPKVDSRITSIDVHNLPGKTEAAMQKLCAGSFLYYTMPALWIYLVEWL